MARARRQPQLEARQFLQLEVIEEVRAKWMSREHFLLQKRNMSHLAGNYPEVLFNFGVFLAHIDSYKCICSPLRS